MVEEALQLAQSEEGAEALSDQERAMITLKEKFRVITRTFFSPEIALANKQKQELREREKVTGTGVESVASGA